jgi:hypothetical protein
MKKQYRNILLILILIISIIFITTSGKPLLAVTDVTCTSDSQCNVYGVQPATCTNNYCQSKINQPIGGQCTWGYQCVTNECSGDGSGGTCTPIPTTTNKPNYALCNSGSECFSTLCLTYSGSTIKACMPTQGIGGDLCSSGQDIQCNSGYSCVSGYCKIKSTGNQVPINLADGTTCTYDYQCLSNYCNNHIFGDGQIGTSSGQCKVSQSTNMINGGSCSTNSNCQSNFCADSLVSLGGTGGKVCADPNAPDFVAPLGAKCDYVQEGVKWVCQSNLICKDHTCMTKEQADNNSKCLDFDIICKIKEAWQNTIDLLTYIKYFIIGIATFLTVFLVNDFLPRIRSLRGNSKSMVRWLISIAFGVGIAYLLYRFIGSFLFWAISIAIILYYFSPLGAINRIKSNLIGR